MLTGPRPRDLGHTPRSAQVSNDWDVYIFKFGEIVHGSKLKKESPCSSFLAGILIMNLPKQLVGIPKQHVPHWDCPGGRGSVCASVLLRSLRPAKSEKCSVIVMWWLKVIVFIPSQSTEILISWSMKWFCPHSACSSVNGNGRKILYRCSDPVSELTLSGYSLVLIE